MNWELVLAAILAAVGWLWWSGLNKREKAIGAARVVSRKAEVQLLDETVALRRMRVCRDVNQRLRILREFGFEYSDTGDNRLPGYVYLLGDQVIEANLFVPAVEESENGG